MADYSTTLLKSLADRARTLGSYARALQSSHSRPDDGYAVALEFFHRYTKLVVRQAEEDWERTGDAKRRHDLLLGHMREFFDREQWFDQRFARGRQADVPRSLQTLARRELRSHGLNDYEPVLTVGPPDNFETHKSDLARYLFEGLYTVRADTDLGDLPLQWRLAIISVPYIEGTRALWYPIPLGHELAHVRLEARRGRFPILDLTNLIDEDDANLAELIDSGLEDERTRGVGIVEQARRTLQAWAEEILCDLNAVRLFGPAGLSAIAEFLGALRPSSGLGAEAPTQTHPRLSIRINAMLEFLKLQGERAIPEELEAWRNYVATQHVTLKQKPAYLEKQIIEAFPTLMSHALSWGDTYVSSGREVEVEWIRRQLLDGVPGGTHCLLEGRRGSALQVADLINASWIAREDLDEEPASDAPLTLQTSGIDPHDRRVILDKLTGKSVDDLEFALLWKTAGREVVNLGEDSYSQGADSADSLPTHGVLSRLDIYRRLARTDAWRLVMTPLMDGSVQDAGVDLRLSPDFIVSRHSATTAFDPLHTAQNPRVMQEAVTKVWGEPFILHPAELVLASTLEYLVIPSDLTAQIVTRSSYGRLGLITATAVQVQPGSRGCITFELVNHGETPIALTPGTRIAQLILFQLTSSPRETTAGTYRFPIGPEFSKVQDDTDFVALRQVRSAVYDAGRVASHTAKRPPAGDQVRFSVQLGFEEANLFQMMVDPGQTSTSVVPVVDLPNEAPSQTMARVMGGESLIEYILAGATSVTLLSAAILRLVRGLARGVIVTARDGKVEVEASKELPRGTVVFSRDPSERYQVTIDDGTLREDLAKALERVIENRRKPWAANRTTDDV